MSMFRIATRLAALGAAAGFVMAVGGLQAKPVTLKLPEETAQFKPGPNLDVVQANCTACHSADYIQTQPRGPKFGKDFWTRVVDWDAFAEEGVISKGDLDLFRWCETADEAWGHIAAFYNIED